MERNSIQIGVIQEGKEGILLRRSVGNWNSAYFHLSKASADEREDRMLVPDLCKKKIVRDSVILMSLFGGITAEDCIRA